MAPGPLEFTDATSEHVAAIVAIERASAENPLVVLTDGLALDEAMRRGHYLTVAIEDGAVAGWIWYSVDMGRGGEEAGQLFRVAVAPGRARNGVGRALVEHAQATLGQRQCGRMRVTLAAGDEAARIFFGKLGYAVAAITMERAL